MSYFITDKCIGCTLCFRLCPVGAIKGNLREKHCINEKRCVECGVCGRACRQGAILKPDGSPAKEAARSEWKKPVIKKTSCSACSMCVFHCTKNALRITEPAYKGDIHVFAELFDSKSCVGCGICEVVCPLHAVHMEVGENL